MSTLCFQRMIDVVKVDIEGAEWPFLHQFIQSEWPKQIKQLAGEYHSPTYKSSPLNVCNYIAMYNDLRRLQEEHGYQVFRTKHNNGCCGRFSVIADELCCYELFTVNGNLRK